MAPPTSLKPASKRGPKSGPRKGGDTYRIGGVNIPFDPDLEFDRPKPTPLFPEYHPPTPKPLTENEEIEVGHFLKLRDAIHNGPLYTVLGDNVRVSKLGAFSAAEFNPFEGMAKYSDRYKKKERALPNLKERPYVREFFPKELWSTLGEEDKGGTGAVIEGSTQGKSLQIPGYKINEGLALLEHELSGDENEEAGPKNKDDEEQGDEEDVDDEYEDEEEGGDYDAEQYFDDGGDDAGEDYDGGEDGGGGDWYD